MASLTRMPISSLRSKAAMRTASVALLAMMLAACASSGDKQPASVTGLATALPPIEHEACGQTAYDQAILDRVVETAALAGHPRPQPRQCPYEPVSDVFARPKSGPITPTSVPVAAATPAKKKGIVQRLREKVRM